MMVNCIYVYVYIYIVRETDEISASFNQVRTRFDIYEQFYTEGGDQCIS